MYKEILRSIDNIYIWPVIGLVLFFLAFAALLFWVYSMRKGFADEMSKLPLTDDINNSGVENGKV